MSSKNNNIIIAIGAFKVPPPPPPQTMLKPNGAVHNDFKDSNQHCKGEGEGDEGVLHGVEKT